MAKVYTNLTLRVTPELADKLSKAAAEDYRTLSATMRLAIGQWLEWRDQSETPTKPRKVRAV